MDNDTEQFPAPEPLAVRLYSVMTAADMLDMSPRYVWQLMREGELSRVKLGSHTRVRDDELAELIDANTIDRAITRDAG